MTQPPYSGAPNPVTGVTGGPPVLGGQLGNDPNSGNVVINPNPGNAVEVRKSPSAFNVYEYFNSNTDYARIGLATALGGPEVIGVQAQPPSVNRDLQIVAAGSGHVIIPALQIENHTINLSADTPIGSGATAPVLLSAALANGIWLVTGTVELATPTNGTLLVVSIGLQGQNAQYANSGGNSTQTQTSATVTGLFTITGNTPILLSAIVSAAGTIKALTTSGSSGIGTRLQLVKIG
jgi:hypothetical protein